jgi:deazaflavin-dependent oxidoreductase (nitroreductase family)
MAGTPSRNSLNAVHRFVLRITRNKVGWRVAGMPVLELTTIGRKSGEKRSSMLTSPAQLGDNYVVVASKGGSDRHPDWFLNLRDNPNVEIVTGGGDPEPRIARIVEAAEREILWRRITAGHKNYAGYQRKTEREIPLVVLEPVQG